MQGGNTPTSGANRNSRWQRPSGRPPPGVCSAPSRRRGSKHVPRRPNRQTATCSSRQWDRARPPRCGCPRPPCARFFITSRLSTKGRSTTIFFAVPARGRFYFAFDIALCEGQQSLLEGLLARLQYLGRAESRARLRRNGDLTRPPESFFRVLPRDRAAMGGWSPSRVPCAAKARDFKASDLWSSRMANNPRPARRSSAATDSSGAPVHLVDALLEAKKPLPYGAMWVEYALPDGCVVHELPTNRVRRPSVTSTAGVATLLFRLCRRVPIPLVETVSVARAYRDAAVRRFEYATRGAHSVALTGREADGTVERKRGHLFYLPQPGEGSSALSTLMVRVPPGTSLSQDELDALMGVSASIWAGMTGIRSLLSWRAFLESRCPHRPLAQLDPVSASSAASIRSNRALARATACRPHSLILRCEPRWRHRRCGSGRRWRPQAGASA